MCLGDAVTVVFFLNAPPTTVNDTVSHTDALPVSAGIQDRDGAARLFEHLTARFPFIEVIIGDGGYAGPKVRKAAPRPVEIVKRSDQASGFEVIPMRWIVERTLAWLTINRRLARDFERYAKTTAAYIQIAMIKLMSRRLARYSYS